MMYVELRTGMLQGISKPEGFESNETGFGSDETDSIGSKDRHLHVRIPRYPTYTEVKLILKLYWSFSSVCWVRLEQVLGRTNNNTIVSNKNSLLCSTTTVCCVQQQHSLLRACSPEVHHPINFSIRSLKVAEDKPLVMRSLTCSMLNNFSLSWWFLHETKLNEEVEFVPK